ncbi:MMPL family transporter [Aeromicrobium terrae]|uniref:RND transporter n=1 Tax=Aeromicrobium terrae TaxID=2498846 RepID=A0A5C8NHD6_9ACTN|nr:MMPL family transporter [Aeromicrobium terrae]TXL60698.1 RND transporter [Aeromicrobium terrae]
MTRRGLLLAVGGLTTLVLVVVGLARLDVETGVDAFVPSGDPTTRATDEVAKSFGGDPIVVLLESRKPYDLLSDENLPQLLRLEGELAQLPDVAALYGPATVLNQVAGQAQTLLAELSGYRDGLRGKAVAAAQKKGASASEAEAAGRRATAKFDERYADLLAGGLPGGLPTLHNQTFVRKVVYNDTGQPRPQWDFVVPAEDAVAILVRPREGADQHALEHLVESVESTVDDSGVKAQDVTVSGVPSVITALGHQVRTEVPVLGGAALLAVGGWFVLMSWTRRRLRLLPLATTLVGTSITLALAGWLSIPLTLGVVAFLPVLLGIGSDFMTYLHRRAGERVVVAAAAATAASFGALAVAPLPVVRDLGIALGFGVLVTLGVSLLAHRWLRLPDYPAEGPRPAASGRAPSRGVRLSAAVVAVAIAAAGWASLPHLPLTADFRSLASDLPAFSDAKHVESVMGSSGEVAVTLTGDDTVSQASLAWMDRAEQTVVAAHGDEMRPVVSPASLLSFLGSDPTAGELEAAMRLLPRYLTSSVMRSDQKMSILSFGVRLDDAQELQALRDDVRRILPTPPTGLRVEVTGLPMVAVSSYEALSERQYLTAGLGIVVAGLVLLIGLRRRTDAVLAVASAVLATGFVLAGMRLVGAGLNPLTAAVGSLAAAVACEFTVILRESVSRGDRRLGRAVTLAAVASGIGYGVLSFSHLSVISEFGMLLAVTVGAALGASRFVVWLAQDSTEPTDVVRMPEAVPELVGAR